MKNTNTKMHRRSAARKWALATLPLVALPFVQADTASASEGASGIDDALIKSQFSEYGITPELQESLLVELHAGRAWDSFGGHEPVSSEAQSLPGAIRTVDRFADGSVRVSEVDQVDVAGERAAVGCQVVSGSAADATWSCNVSTNVVIASAAFRVRVHAVRNGASGIKSFSKGSEMVTSGIGGTVHNRRVALGRKVQSGNQPAFVTARFTWTAAGGWASHDYWLEFDIRGTKTWATNN